MTDIVERLRQAQDKAEAIPGLSVAIFRDAADEIERLRTDNERLRRTAGEPAALRE